MGVDSNLTGVPEFNVFEIVKIGNSTLTPANPFPTASTITTTIAHNLGIKPSFMVFATVPDYTSAGLLGSNRIVNLPVSLLSASGTGSVTVLYSQARADTTNLYIDLIQPNGVDVSNLNQTWTFKYYLLRERSA